MSLSGTILVLLVVFVVSHQQVSGHVYRRRNRPLRRFSATTTNRFNKRPFFRRALYSGQPQQQQVNGWEPEQQLQQVEQRLQLPDQQPQVPVQLREQQMVPQPAVFQPRQLQQPRQEPQQLQQQPQQQPQQRAQTLAPQPRQQNSRALASITFYVYTRNYAQPGILQAGDERSLSTSGFSPERPTKVLIHGFGSNVNRTMMTIIKDAYLQAMDVNVLSVDWSPLSAVPWYPAARSNVEVVGPYLATLLDWLAERGMVMDSVHLVGHSLGAHVAGIAGANLRNGRVSRISGLDPARPGFQDVDLRRRLDASDAGLVDVIHTTAGFLGMEDPVGHIDFYPNGGTMSQPGCITDLAGLCSHEKAFRIFRDSIRDVEFDAARCDSMQSAMRGRCNGPMGVMGERAGQTQPGIYYSTTR